MLTLSTVLVACTLGAAQAPPAAATHEASPAGGAAEDGAAATAPIPAPAGAPASDLQADALGPPARADQLEGMRGGSDTPSSAIVLNGTVSANSAANVTTGSNVIDSGAFANASGVPMVVQNSGANVLIQNATVINLELH